MKPKRALYTKETVELLLNKMIQEVARKTQSTTTYAIVQPRIK